MADKIFERYNSIENSYQKKTIDYITEQGFTKGDFSVTEKIHGANFSAWITASEIKYGKRSGMIKDGEDFYAFKHVVEPLESSFAGLFKTLNTGPDSVVGVYGELFGGGYPHPDVPRVNGRSQIQSEVAYGPDNYFMIFDIMVDGQLLEVDEVFHHCDKYNLLRTQELFRGPLAEALQYANDFPTGFPKTLGLPEIEGNISEGVVIKPLTPKFLMSGKRVILKNKNAKFSENSNKVAKEPLPDLTEPSQKVLDDMTTYICKARLQNVISKIGVVGEKDFGKLMGLMQKDLIEDYIKDFEGALTDLDKVEKKRVTKTVGQRVASLIREEFLNIIDGVY